MSVDDELFAEMAQSLGFGKIGIPQELLYPEMARVLESYYPMTALPEPNQSVALSYDALKTSALAYDRVLSFIPLTRLMPKGIGCYCSSFMEEIFFCLFVLSRISRKKKICPSLPPCTDEERIQKIQSGIRLIGASVAEKIGRQPAIIFNSQSAYQNEFLNGPQHVLTAALKKIAMVDEENLTWEQVLEFRKDAEARTKYRRLVRWIDSELKDKSPEEVQDVIAIRLDDYEWGIKKHGMKTMLGSLACVLDPKFITSAATVVGASALAGGELWAALSAVILPVGRAALSFGLSYIDALDARREDNYEVAYIRDIKKATK